jgi:hypothetical protein
MRTHASGSTFPANIPITIAMAIRGNNPNFFIFSGLLHILGANIALILKFSLSLQIKFNVFSYYINKATIIDGLETEISL